MSTQPRRSLIMAGGGLKVALQAGVLQVWLDEARDADGEPLRFEHADGASGGVFNLAMWCQGLTGTQIADNWRRTRPLRGAQPNWRHWLPRFESVMSYDRFRRVVLRDTWGLDWDRIRATGRRATFNVWDVGHQTLRVLDAAQMDEDALIAAVSLPFWFPPVWRGGVPYIDAVFATDANLGAAIESGADELWVIWTVSRRGRWGAGPIAQYFAMIESAANSQLDGWFERIERNNEAIAQGRPGEFGRTLTLRYLPVEVPVHYLFVFTRGALADAVERGVAAGRRWCQENGFTVVPAGDGLVAPTTVEFRERMSGPISFGTGDPEDSARRATADVILRLRVSIEDLARFRADPAHRAQVSGTVECAALGGARPIASGEVALLTDDGDPERKQMRYVLRFTDLRDTPLVLTGVKEVADGPGWDLWPDTTTLFTRIRREGAGVDDPDGAVAAGVLRLPARSFARQLFTFRSRGPDRLTAVPAFAAFFLRQLGQVYGHRSAAGSTARARS